MLTSRTEILYELLNAIVATAADAIIAADAALTIVVFSPGAEKIFGYAAADVIGRPLAALLPESQRATHAQHMQRFAESDVTTRTMGQRGRVAGQRKNGEIFDAAASISHFTVGGISMFAVVMRDVSQAQREYEALRTSEARLRTILETVTEYVGLLDPSGRLIRAGGAALRLLRLASADVEGRPFWETPWWSHSPPLQQRLREAIARAASGSADSFEATHPAADGGEVDVDFFLTPVLDDAGKVIALLPEGRDVTARKAAERAHLELEQRLEMVIANSPDNIFMQDLDLRYTWIRNPPSTMPETGFLGRTDAEVLAGSGHGADLALRLERAKRAAIATGQRQELDVEMPTSVGLRYFEATIEPMRDSTGAVTGILGYARDRTEARDALRALDLAKQQAERAAQSKARLVAVVSHDLRQPLRTAGLLASVIERSAKDPAIIDVVRQLERALGSATDLLGSLLNVSRLESGAVQPQLEWVAIGDLCARLHEEFQIRAAEKQQCLEVTAPRVEIRSDRLWLRQILQNLLGNALRYTGEGGTIALRALLKGEDLELEVRDSGVGIPADQLERIFDEFYQVDSASAQRRGWGLGLSIVKHAAAVLGIRLSVASEPGKGTVFTLTIPGPCRAVVVASPSSASAATPAAAVPAAGPVADVLVVDDDQVVAKATAMLLKAEGFSVDIVSGMADLQHLLERPGFSPAAVVADYHLHAGETGPDVVRHLRTTLGRDVPAIFVSGDTSTMPATACALVNTTVLSKPVEPDAFLRVLRHCLTAA